MAFKYRKGIVGGTFDRLHLGHTSLLDTAFHQSEKVIVGVATAKLLDGKSASTLIESFKTREDAVIQYLTKKGYLSRAEIIPIDDIYGNGLTEVDIQAVFMTENTSSNVHTLNAERQKRGFTPLAEIVSPLMLGNDGNVISSERIRKGEIDREGNSYAALFAKEKYLLPQSARELLRKPFGAVYEDIDAALDVYGDRMMIAVGDVVSLSLYSQNHQAAVSVVDLKTRRNHVSESDVEIFYSMSSLKAARNEAGSIENNAVESIQSALQTYASQEEEQTIVVAGEEDLLTIPAILLAPLASVVIYGQFEVGAIAVEVTEEKKKEIVEIFKMFV